MATTFADILRQQQMLQQQQQQAQQQQGQGMTQLGQMGGKQLAAALRGGGTTAATPSATGGAGFGLGQPLVSGQMGASSMAGGGAGGGFMAGLAPVAAAGATAYHADKIGDEAGRFGDKLGLKKTGLPDQARAVGNFVKGDFGESWGNLKDSVKNIFSIF